jgi:hypothetical protein
MPVVHKSRGTSKSRNELSWEAFSFQHATLPRNLPCQMAALAKTLLRLEQPLDLALGDARAYDISSTDAARIRRGASFDESDLSNGVRYFSSLGN